MKPGTRVTIIDVGHHELGPRNMSGKIVKAYGDGVKVEVDGLHGGVLYFRESQLKEEGRSASDIVSGAPWYAG